MITREQVLRCEQDFAKAASEAEHEAASAERALESYRFSSTISYSYEEKSALEKKFADADQRAEGLAWVLYLIREEFKRYANEV